MGTLSDTGAQAVTEHIGDDFGLAVNNLKGTFGTTGYAIPAAVAALFVDFDNFSHDFHG